MKPSLWNPLTSQKGNLLKKKFFLTIKLIINSVKYFFFYSSVLAFNSFDMFSQIYKGEIYAAFYHWEYHLQ